MELKSRPKASDTEANIFVNSSTCDQSWLVVDFLFIVTLIVGVCNCSMFYCTLLYVHSSIAIILMGKRELVALLNLSSWCLVLFERLFLAVPQGCLRFVIVVFPDHTHLLFWKTIFDLLFEWLLKTDFPVHLYASFLNAILNYKH